MATRNETQDTHPASSIINTHFNYLRDAPAPDRTYSAYEAPKGIRHHRRKYIDAGIITVVDCTNDKHQSNIYRTDERAYASIQSKIRERDLLPCGHAGFTNNQGKGYGCGYEFCTARFSRETVEGLEL